LILKMVCKLKLKVAAISVGCRPRCSKSRTRARVLTRAGVEPRRKRVIKEPRSPVESLMGCAFLAIWKDTTSRKFYQTTNLTKY
jgi:hypothetical protein